MNRLEEIETFEVNWMDTDWRNHIIIAALDVENHQSVLNTPTEFGGISDGHFKCNDMAK